LRIESLVWLDEIVEKLARKHQVCTNEVREVPNSKPRFRFVEKGLRSGEDLYAAMGRTQAGRYLIVFFVYKRNRAALPVSARDMSPAERRKYERK
jgi:uncharacterized DUF497 family protein